MPVSRAAAPAPPSQQQPLRPPGGSPGHMRRPRLGEASAARAPRALHACAKQGRAASAFLAPRCNPWHQQPPSDRQSWGSQQALAPLQPRTELLSRLQSPPPASPARSVPVFQHPCLVREPLASACRTHLCSDSSTSGSRASTMRNTSWTLVSSHAMTAGSFHREWVLPT